MDSRIIKLNLALGLTLATSLAAQDFSGLTEPLVPDRPDFTEGTSTLPPGHFQVEGGYTFTRQGDEETSALGELLVRISAGERLEARLGIGSYDWVDTGLPGEGTISGYEDPFVQLKMRLTERDPDLLAPGHPAIALLFGTSLPVGSSELAADAWQPEAILAFDWDFTSRFSLGANLGYSYQSDAGERFHQAFASLSAGIGITDRLGAFVETFGFSKESAEGSSTQYVDSGLTWLVSDDLALDVRLGAGLDDPHPNWFAGFGASVRF
jgi:hypothetical protein